MYLHDYGQWTKFEVVDRSTEFGYRSEYCHGHIAAADTEQYGYRWVDLDALYYMVNGRYVREFVFSTEGRLIAVEDMTDL